jgi:beta-phosphoglucomutase-like phosphatase (HAD superfamily)
LALEHAGLRPLARRHGGKERLAHSSIRSPFRRGTRGAQGAHSGHSPHEERSLRAARSHGPRAAARRDRAPARGGRERRRTLAIASTTTRENIDALLAPISARRAGRFSVIGAGDAVQRKKPAPDIYRFVLRELGESSADCVAVEDSGQGLAAAKARDCSPWSRRAIGPAERIFPVRICC